MSDVFQVPGAITKATTMSRQVRLTVDTMDVLSGDALYRLFSLIDKPGWFTFNAHQIDAADIIDLPPVKQPSKRTKSQQLRAVLWQLWNKDAEGFDEFDDYYNDRMDKLIERLKERLT